MRIWDLLKSRFRDPRGDLFAGHEARIAGYLRYLRGYLGYALKDATLTGVQEGDWRRIRFNLNRPIVNLAAAWMAARPLDWDVAGDREATAACYAIWNRGGGDAAFLSAALGGAIYGDQVALAAENEDGPLIEFLDPGICYPRFSGRDHLRLLGLDVAFEEVNDQGECQLYREIYEPTGMSRYEGDDLVAQVPYEAIPCAWIRNQEVQGLPFGLSDLDNVGDLVEEYDHVAGKQTRAIDYWSKPTPVVTGEKRGDLELKLNSIIYLPKADSDMKFLQWDGPGPGVDDHLTRIRNTIAELSETPAVAFGQADSGLTSISGVALEILYGPLTAKTGRKHACYGPPLEYVMWLCLRRAGHNVAKNQVKCLFPRAMPIDAMGKIAEESAKVASGLSSRRSAMDNLGVEDAGRELRRILVEEALLTLPSQTGAASDPVKAAAAAAKGSVAANRSAPGVVNVAAAAGGAGAPAPPSPDELEGNLADLLLAFDKLAALEDDWEQKELDGTDEGEDR